MTRLARRLLLVIVLALVPLPVASCGLPQDQSPTTVPASAVPFGLLRTQPATAAATNRGPKSKIFFLLNGKLHPVARSVPGVNLPAELVRALLAGPRPEESAQGVTSAIPAQTRLLSLDVSGMTVTLDLSKEFGELGGPAQVQAVAQLVYTVSQSARIGDVRFDVEGKPIEVPDATGSLTLDAVSPSDYPTLPARR